MRIELSLRKIDIPAHGKGSGVNGTCHFVCVLVMMNTDTLESLAKTRLKKSACVARKRNAVTSLQSLHVSNARAVLVRYVSTSALLDIRGGYTQHTFGHLVGLLFIGVVRLTHS